MHSVIDFLTAAGGFAAEHLLLPLLAWTVLWLIAEAALGTLPRTHPLVRYRAAQAVLVALPVGILIAAVIEVPALLPAVATGVYIPEIVALPLTGEPVSMLEHAGGGEAALPPITLITMVGGVLVLAALMAGVLLIRLAAQGLAVRRMRRGLQPVAIDGLRDEAREAARHLGVKRRVEVVAAEGVEVPMTFGLRRPSIALPPWLEEGQRRIALLHEMVHVRHFDAAAQWVEAALGALFAFHPGVLRLRRHCALLRELSCDAALVGEAAVGRRDYASLLYVFVSPPARQIPVTVGMADRRSHITKRLEAMKHFSPSISPPRALALFVSLAVLAAGSLAVTAGQALARQEAQTPEHAFRITYSVEEDRARLVCEYGCAFIDLSFTLAPGASQAVDYSGMTSVRDAEAAGADERFHIVLTRGDDDVQLSCGRGCTWTNLTMSCADGACTHRIDERGMLSLRSSEGTGTLRRPSPLVFIDGERASLEQLRDHVARDEIQSREVIPPDVAVPRYGEAGAQGVLLIRTKAAAASAYVDERGRHGPPPPPPPAPAPSAAPSDTTVFVVVEEMPEPRGGLEQIQRNVRYPELARRAGIEGTVFVQFVVNADGSVSEARCTRDVGAGTCEAAIAGIERTPFTPGYQAGEPVRVRFSLPVRFALAAAEREAATAEEETVVAAPRDAAVGHGAAAQPSAEDIQFAVTGAHPQPSGNEVIITLALPDDAEVRVEVFDMAGRRVLQVPARNISAGANRYLSVDVRGVASGAYVYRLIAEMESGQRAASGQLTIAR